MVAGVIVAAAGYALAIAHPGANVDIATACLTLGGPKLYVASLTLFKWAIWGDIPLARSS
jgi:low temperature requirement protein LtrA